MKNRSRTTSQQTTVQNPTVPQYGQNYLQGTNQQIAQLTQGMQPTDLYVGMSPLQRFGINYALGDQLGGQLQAPGNVQAPQVQRPLQYAASPTPTVDPSVAYLQANPDVAQEARRVASLGFGTSGVPSSFDANNDGVFQPEEYSAYHFQNFGQSEGREMPSGVVAMGEQPRQVALTPTPTPAPLPPADPLSGGGIIGRADPYITEAGDIVRDVLGRDTPQVDLQGYDAALAQSQGYDPSLAQSQGYDAALAQLGGYDPATMTAAQGEAVLRSLADIPQLQAANANAARIEQSDINRLLNPQLESVVQAGLSDAEAAQARARAQLAAQAAGAGAFGGSRFGVQQAVQRSEDIRNLGNLSAGLRGQAYDRAAGLAAQDAARRQQANLTNAGFQQQANLGQFGAAVDALAANQNAANQFGLANLGNLQQAALANMSAQNQAGAFGADAANRGALANQAALNQAGAFGADAANRVSLANQAALNQAGAFGADAANRIALANQNAQNLAAQFGANAANAGQLTNAQLQESAMGRALQGAGMLSGLGAQSAAAGRADLGTLLGLGGMQQADMAAQAYAPLNLAQALAQIQGSQVPGIALQTGQTTNQSGTTTQTQSQSPLGMAAGLAGAALTGGFNPFGAAGGFIGSLLGGGAQPQTPFIGVSDERLKENVSTSHYDSKGRRWVNYNLKGDPAPRYGVIAQEVVKTDPEAVINVSGLLAVDYSKIAEG